MQKIMINNINNLINWSELSRLITGGGRNGIRSNKIPKCHEAKIKDLINTLMEWKERAGI